MATPRSVTLYTLGCKLNFSESSSISRQFEQAGYAVLPFEEGADVYVINTCSVTEFADRKCRNIVRRALRLNPQAQIVVIGCYAQLKPQEIINIPGVDLVLGAAEKFNILDYLNEIQQGSVKGMVQAGDIATANEFVSSFSFGDRTRSFLKVQDGCNYSCTFCTIPLARGASRSDTVEQVVQNAATISAKGIKEIVLTGVNLGDFGNGTEVIEGLRPQKEHLFIDLIRALDTVKGIERFRISSIEPNLLTKEIIEFVAASERFVPHFHIPLQSGNDKQLRQMRRRYPTSLYKERIEWIRDILPDACIGVDVIVGFPGETDEDFKVTVDFLEELDISYLHVFTYSERPNTIAAEMKEVVPMSVRRSRNEHLRKLSDRKKKAFYARFSGETHRVLLEADKEPRYLSGYTSNYLKVRVKREELIENALPCAENEMVHICLKNLDEKHISYDAEPVLTTSIVRKFS